jgi:hypothetical protein
MIRVCARPDAGRRPMQKHRDEIHLDSYSWGETQTGMSNSGSPLARFAGAVRPHAKGQSQVMQACAAGRH